MMQQAGAADQGNRPSRKRVAPGVATNTHSKVDRAFSDLAEDFVKRRGGLFKQAVAQACARFPELDARVRSLADAASSKKLTDPVPNGRKYKLMVYHENNRKVDNVCALRGIARLEADHGLVTGGANLC